MGHMQLQRTKKDTDSSLGLLHRYSQQSRLFPSWHLSGSIQLLALCHCHVLCPDEGQQGDWAWLLPPCEAHSLPELACAAALFSSSGVPVQLQPGPGAPAWAFRACHALLFGVSRISPPVMGSCSLLVHLHNSRFGNAELCCNWGSSKVQPGGFILPQTAPGAESW